ELGGAAVGVAAQYLAQKLDLIATQSAVVLNAGGPGLPPIAVDAAKLQSAALRLGDDIESIRTPYGPVIETHFDKDYSGTWGDSLADPTFSPGNVNFPH